ncbi:hypothetical protein VOLCADRAFT_101170 [Volvox carteri f. nagariensis]|uniref:Uncharacterized protein n=1 Tax=Volvox carteri f. nagariensis TaxID=3068 RepID=D8ULY0_VOLCA|nr:uncharacterized protein VOLCADRAFT_101170 [Volvox carteri f. nagariensis]EFJ39269.1 hypothetical protein VOLCADRAFT_101170 [Volvox carteri f. nagariensis]|eukprot:XP_002959666.1 hypothetical protein VOLCADRAFT_101170 [Volvox carteri f. nagariensis]
MPRHAFSAIKCCLHMLTCSPWPVDHQLRASHPQQLHLVIHMKNTQHLILAARHVRSEWAQPIPQSRVHHLGMHGAMGMFCWAHRYLGMAGRLLGQGSYSQYLWVLTMP